MAEPSHHSLNRVRRTGHAVLAVLGRQQWLDRPSYRLEHALTFLFAATGRHRDTIGNTLHGTWLGHPLHPALTAVPVGAATTTVALDAVDALSARGQGWREASTFTLGVGLVASIGAAATGMTDWQHTHEEARRVGLAHGVLNGVATLLYGFSWLDRRRGRYGRGIACSAVGYGVTIGSGYLGAALVYGSGTGVDKAGARLVDGRWTPTLPATALAGRPKRVEVDGVGVVLYRSDEQVLAVGEYCPHLGAPMDDGWVDRGRIVCPWHGSRFECESGEVLRGPATAALPSYQVRIREGIIEVHGVSK